MIDKRLKQRSIFVNAQNDKFVQCLSPSNIPSKYLCKNAIEDEIQTDIYQANFLELIF